MSYRRVALAAGHTAGHVNLAIATARALERAFNALDIVFIGARAGPENELVPRRTTLVNPQSTHRPIVHEAAPDVRKPRSEGRGNTAGASLTVGGLSSCLRRS